MHLERRCHDARLHVDGRNPVGIRIFAQDPRPFSRSRREETVRIGLGDDGVTLVVFLPLDLLRVGELSGVGQPVADRAAEEDELSLHLVPEIGVGHQPFLVAELQELLGELLLTEVLNGRHADLRSPLGEDAFLLLALDRVARLLLFGTSGEEAEERNGEEGDGVSLHELTPG